MNIPIYFKVLLGLLVGVGFSGTLAWSQVLDSPVTVPFAIEATYTASAGGAIFDGDFGTGPSGSVSHTSPGVGAQSTSRVVFNLKPGKDYDFSVTTSQVTNFKLHFDPPPGYRVFIDDVERLILSSPTGTSDNYKVRISRTGSEAVGLIAEASSLRPTRTLWSVSMGYARNGRGVGAIEFRETSIDSAVNPANLYYDSEIAEVDVIAPSGPLQQVRAPDGLAHIVDSGSYYEIKFYRPGSFGTKTGGSYPITGSPFVVYKVEKVATDHMKITHTRGSRTETTELKKLTSTSWEVKDWTKSGETCKRVINYGYPSAGVETVEVTDGVAVVTRVKKEYTATAGGQVELTREIRDEGVLNLTTQYTYYTNSASPGNYLKLESVTNPDGSWAKYSYYDTPLETRGQIYRIFEPYRDSPATAAAATTGNSKMTEFVYEADWTGKNRRPISITTTTEGQQTRGIDIDYVDSTVNSQPLVTETRTEFSESTLDTGKARTSKVKYYREDAASTGLHHWPGRIHSVESANGTKRAHVYIEGFFNPSLRAFTPNPGDYHVLELVVHGSANSAHGSAYTASGYTIDSVYTVTNQSYVDETVRATSGEVYYQAKRVHNGSSFVKNDGILSANTDRNPLYYYHDSGRYSAEWTYTDGRLTQYKDVDGVPFTYTYDRHGRVASMTKSSLSASGSYPARPAVATAFEYDADNRRLFKRVGPSSEIVESWTYDKAGRINTATHPDTGTVTYSYPSAREVKQEFPGTIVGSGATRAVTIETYIDGRFKKRSGNAAIPEYHAYNTEGGEELRVISPTLGSSERWQYTWYNWVGNPTFTMTQTFLSPTVNFALNMRDFEYCGCGRLTYTRNWTDAAGMGLANPLTPHEITSYDNMGNISQVVLDLDLDGVADTAGTDRISQLENRFEVHNSQTWQVKRTKVLPTLSSSTARTVAEVRSQITGLSSTQIAVVVSIDSAGTTTNQTTTVNRASRLRTATTSIAGVSNNATREWLNGLPYKESSASAVVTTLTRDNWDRVTKIAGRGTVETNLSYYAGTRLVYQKSNSYYTTDRFTYDAAGRVTLHETFNYSTLTGARTATARYGYNALGQVARQWGSSVQPTEFEYNEFGQRTAMTTFQSGTSWATSSTWPTGFTGNTTIWTYQTETGLLIKKEDAAGKKVEYEYNIRNQVSRRTENGSIVTDYHYYDGAEGSSHPSYRTGELKKVDYPGTSYDVTFTYDRLGRISTVAEDATGGTRSFVYRNGSDLQLDYEELPGFFNDGSTRRLTRTYASSGTVGRYTGFQFGPSGSPVHNTAYAYSASTGRLDTVARSGHTTVSYGYLSGSDHITSVTAGSWARSQSWESGREAMTSLTQNWTGSGARTVADYYNDFDWRLNRDAVTLTGELATQQGHANGIKTKYWNFLSGDNWDREEIRETKTEQLDTGTEITARYRKWTYDAAQSRSLENRTGVWATTYASNSRDQLTSLSGSESATVTHNDEGNMTSDGTWGYTYDAENRLIKMQQNAGGTLRLEFKYDYMGRRIEKAVFPTSGSSTADKRIRYVYDGWNLVAELDAKSSNAVLRTYTWGLDASETLSGAGGIGGLLRIEEGANKYYPVYDTSNNITGLLRDNGSTSTLVASYTYGPFGEKLQADWAVGGYTDNNPFRFSTKYTDSETGLVYYGLRYYHPKFGRFINRDPIGEEGGLNLYNFVGNNPTNRGDYLGMLWVYREICEWVDDYTNPDMNTASIRLECWGDWYEEDEGDIDVPGGGGPASDPETPPEPTEPNKPDRSRDKCFVYDVVRSDGKAMGTVTNPTHPSGGSFAGQPMFVPSEADIYANIKSARWMNPISFVDNVRKGGDWDYKRTDFVYMPYGNFHFGVVGRASGYTQYLLLAGGGFVSDDTKNGAGRKVGVAIDPSGFYDSNISNVSSTFDFGVEPFGDSWFDNHAIKAGIGFYNQNFSSLMFTGFASENKSADRLVKRPCNDSEYAVFVNAPNKSE